MNVKIKDFEFKSFLGVNEGTCLLSYTIEFPNNVKRPYVSKSYSGCHMCDFLEKPLSHLFKFIENSAIISERLSAVSDQFQKNMNMKSGEKFPNQEDVKEFGGQYRLLTEKLREEFPLGM